jgi:hypothetical protein
MLKQLIKETVNNFTDWESFLLLIYKYHQFFTSGKDQFCHLNHIQHSRKKGAFRHGENENQIIDSDHKR